MATKRIKKAKPEEDRVVTAYYMLARVVDQNTQMFKAFIDMISDHKEALDEKEKRTAPPKPTNTISKDQIKEVLIRINKTCGKEKATKFLYSFGAKTISQVAPVNYDVFVKSGNYMIQHYGGDVL
tara:strand:- start:27 stop:401 length:375 start_codon:yes stop_codon:yes gene_type:complete